MPLTQSLRIGLGRRAILMDQSVPKRTHLQSGWQASISLPVVKVTCIYSHERAPCISWGSGWRGSGWLPACASNSERYFVSTENVSNCVGILIYKFAGI